MPKSRNSAGPTSCQFCRMRKLKCNRVHPCSNCSARGAICSFRGKTLAESEPNTGSKGRDELLERVERLETIVLASPAKIPTPSTPNDRLTQAISTPTADSLASDTCKSREEDSHQLENGATREDSLLPSLSRDLIFEVHKTDELPGDGSCQCSGNLTEGIRPNGWVICFPSYNVAMDLLRSYESNVHVICPILHVPTIRIRMRNFYQRLMQDSHASSAEAALILSIFAIAAFFYSPAPNSEPAMLRQGNTHVSKAFSRIALDALDHSRRTTSGNLDDVQAHTIMSLVLLQLDGFSTRARLLFMTALFLAKDLRLHRLDASENVEANARADPRTKIALEMKRRVFWFLTSADWLYSAVSGPQEGIYTIHPDHMNVRLPENCNDDEMVTLDQRMIPMHPQPTAMTYFLLRIRLAQLCREIVDSVPLDKCALLQLPYDRIIALDQKLVQFNSDLPFFFKSDDENRRKSEQLQMLYPQLPLLRYCLIQAIHSRRCKLHQSFLFRQHVDPRYTYSRKACIESAIEVIQSDQGVVCPDPPWISSARRGIATHFKHLAIVVLVMDLCFNRGQPDEQDIKLEVKNALAAFEGARHVSHLLGHFLDSIYQTLKKHRIDMGDPVPPKSVRVLVSSDERSETPQIPHDASSPLPDPYFEDFWRTAAGNDPNLNPLPWDEFFSTIDSRPPI